MQRPLLHFESSAFAVTPGEEANQSWHLWRSIGQWQLFVFAEGAPKREEHNAFARVYSQYRSQQATVGCGSRR
jgi:hypothetical protein